MKKLFLIMLIFLLPLQATWAAVANYDTQDVHDSSAHFGHHEHQAIDHNEANIDIIINNTDQDSAPDVSIDGLKNHIHYGFIHLSCGVGLTQCLPVFAPDDNQYTNSYLFNYHSPPDNTLDRPNWTMPV